MKRSLGVVPGWGLCLSVVIVMAAPATPSARADGSVSISGAPVVSWGEQTFGNTANGFKDAEGVYYSWWGLAISAGDAVSIQWEAPDYLSGEYPEIHVYPAGTTDFNYRNVPESEYHLQGLNSNGRNEQQLTAPQTGIMPLAFISEGGCCSGRVGPYDFVASVRHEAVIALHPRRRIRRRGVLAASVNSPDGSPITTTALSVRLQARVPGRRWRTIGAATPSAGTATIRYRVPGALLGRRSVLIRALGVGGEYQRAVSRGYRVRIGGVT